MAMIGQRLARWARSELQFRKAQVAKAFTWSPGPATEDRLLWKFEADDPEALTDWVASTDEVVDGRSRCTFTVREDKVAVFEGRIELNPEGTTAERGFCAIRARIPRLNSDLDDYEGLGLRVRADDNVYALNVKARSFFPDDLYQGFIRVGSNEFVDVELPFEKLLLTSYGFQKMVNRPVPQDKLTHLGITIIAEEDTDFRLEIESISAVASVEEEQVEERVQEVKERERQERLKLSIAKRKRFQQQQRNQGAHDAPRQ